MEKKKLNKLYDNILELQQELETSVDNAPVCMRTMTIKALAAAYELQDYIASILDADNFLPPCEDDDLEEFSDMF